MAGPTPSSHAGNDDAAGTGRGHVGGRALWQKVVGLMGVAVVVALVILLLAVDHGPGRHVPGGGHDERSDVEGG